jgi:hypothetical protein
LISPHLSLKPNHPKSRQARGDSLELLQRRIFVNRDMRPGARCAPKVCLENRRALVDGDFTDRR